MEENIVCSDDEKIVKKKKKKTAAMKLQIVPWHSMCEWEIVCELFRSEKYEEVVAKASHWRERVPSLPIGVEITLPLVQAIIQDCQDTGNLSSESIKSLYSLALTRFTNHINHIGTSELVGKGGSLPMFQTASHLSVPEWIIDLRHEVCHGAGIPSIETLRFAAIFMKNWLKENYWIPTKELLDQKGQSLLVHNTSYEKEEKAIEEQMAQLLIELQASLMAKLKERMKKGFKKSALLKSMKDSIASLNSRIFNLLVSHPVIVMREIARKFIPSEEKFMSFCRLFPDIKSDEEAFGNFFKLWLPLISLLDKKGKIPLLLAKFGEKEIFSEFEEWLTFQWICQFLDEFPSVANDLDEIIILLKHVILKRDIRYNEVIDRLLNLTEIKLGKEKIELIKMLVKIGMKDEPSFQLFREKNQILTLDDLPIVQHMDSEADQDCWQEDSRSGVFWNDFPIGALIN